MTESDLSTVALWSYGLAALGFAVFTLRLAIGGRRGLPALLLVAATAATTVWALATAAVTHWPIYLLWAGATAADALRYAVWFLFMGALLRSARGGGASFVVPRWVMVLAAVAIVGCVLLTYAPPAMTMPETSARTASLGLRLGLAVFGLYLVEQLWRGAQLSSRWALRPLCVALAGVFIFDLYMFADAMLFAHLDAQIWIARGVANALVIPFIAISTARNPNWAIDMHLSRGAVMHSTALALSGVFLLLVAGAGYIAKLAGGEWGRALQLEVFFLALVIGVFALSSGGVRSRLRVFVSKHFFSYRYDYREAWLRFTRELAAATRASQVRQNAVAALANLVESPAGALWLRDRDRVFRGAANWNMPAPGVDQPADSSLVKFLQKTAWVVDLEQYRKAPQDYPDLVVPPWLASLPSARLVLPLVAPPDLVGFIVLAEPRAKLEVNWEVRDLLKVASSQAASYLAQLEATEALVEVQKFDAFNRMSAFVVHDLKNLVSQLSLMLKNAQRHRDNPEFQQDMLGTVQHVVGRMNQLMLQLRTGATPVAKPGLTDVEAVIRAVCRSYDKAQSRIDLDLAPGLHALGHEDRLDHVIGHLVQNALDATSSGGRVAVSLFREATFVVVEVIDRGVGMSAEFIRERLFRPFETSKTNGMGIGVYESAQYVSSLGGKIEFQSTPGEGTRVRLLLPAADSAVPPPRAELLA